MRQDEIIKQLSDKELIKQLILSQLFFLGVGIVSSFFLFDNLVDWLRYFAFYPKDIFYYGIISGLSIVIINLLLTIILPKRYLDDGGINERVFKNRSVHEVFMIALIVAVAEEVLFRGVIQTTFGYIIASFIFALVHVRYIRKPVLFISVLFVSLYIGYLFVLTENLIVTITVHFIVDFLLGLVIRKKR